MSTGAWKAKKKKKETSQDYRCIDPDVAADDVWKKKYILELGISALQLASNKREWGLCACMHAPLVAEKGEREGREVQSAEIK